MIDAGLSDLKRLLEEGFARLRLAEAQPISLEVYATPRRLVAYCPKLIASQPDSVELLQGPPQRAAFDADGKPTKAALSFAAKVGVDLDRTETITTPKGQYLAYRKMVQGRPTSEILGELIPQAILGIAFPRSMYWEQKSGPRFIRPIRSLLALYGGRVVPCSIGEVHADHWTFGHRQLGKPSLRISDFSDYRESLRASFVILDPQERKTKILEGIHNLLSAETGLRLKENEELLNTLVHLTEYPAALLGSFDEVYLELPEEVLITVMRGHQKYFSVERSDGTLAPRFVAVMNLDADESGAICHGHERVLRARFNDARFFWEQDGKTTLEQRLEHLRHVTFQSQLGSYYDKAERMSELATRLAEDPDLRQTVSLAEIQSAARFAKCDLTTELVKEFTELQGVIGGLYAQREGLAKEVSTAIYDHYLPQSMEDSSPRTLSGAIVSIADRMDTLEGCFGVGLIPSGSKDPFALRRAAQGVIRILADHRLRFHLSHLAARAVDVYQNVQSKTQMPEWKPAGVTAELTKFLEDRLRYYLREVRGFAYDEVNAVLAAAVEREDVVTVLERLQAVSKIRPTENFEPLAAAFKRIKNILQQARQSSGYTGGELNPGLLEPGPEAKLYNRYREVEAEVTGQKRAGNYLGALEAIASLRPDIDLFFDKILVMSPQEELRRNRLTLLSKLLTEFSTIADFSEIVVAEERKAGAR